MFQALNVINLENVSVSRSTVILKKDANFFTCFGKLLPFVFDSRHGSTESVFFGCFAFINERSDQ